MGLAIFLRMAVEPLYKDRGRPQTEYRTHERYAQLYVEDGQYHVNFGNDRGSLETHDFSLKDRDLAISKFEEAVADCDMEEDSFKSVWDENKKATLIDIVNVYLSAGDWLSGMDAILEQMKEDTRINFKYKNLYSNVSGFLAHVKIRKRGFKGQLVEVFIQGSDMGHFVQAIEDKV